MAQVDQATPYSDSMLAHALSYAAQGWPVFPLVPGAKVPVISKRAGGNGWKDATTDQQQIRSWWQRWPRANIGMPTGARSGVVIVDEDPRNGGDTTPLLLPPTLTVKTPSGGRHYYYGHPGGHVPKDNTGKLAKGVDALADGAYAVLPPSVLADGISYTWDDPDQPMAGLPVRLAEVLRGSRGNRSRVTDSPPPTRDDTAAHWLDKALARASVGSRNDTGFWLACQLRDAGMSEIEAGHVMRAYAARVPDAQSYSDREALSSLRTAYAEAKREEAKGPGGNGFVKPALKITKPITPEPPRQTPEQPPTVPPEPDGPLHCTDMGNARRFVLQHGGDVRYVGLWGHWMTWDGRRWEHDWTGEAMRRAKGTVRTLYNEVATAEDKDERKDLLRWATRSESRERLAALLSVAQSEPELARVPDAFDSNPWLLAVQNGTLDLRTGALGPHDPEHNITRLAPVEYHPDAECPTWLAFLDRIMAGNARLIAFLQRAVGYSLTDSTSAQVLFLLHGSGANGKSRFLEAIEGVLGDYGMSTPTSTLMAKRDNNIPNDVARLKGARFVKAIETEEGHALAESLVKQMTGGDMISARFMRGEWFDFKPTFKLWLAANHLPNIRGTDDGIWRRIRYVPFEVQIPEGEKDEELGTKLQAEYSGILAWAVRGCLEWQRDGLGYPEEVREATQAYRDSMNHFGRFLEDRCMMDKAIQVSAKQLRQAYEQWCEGNGERPKAQTWVGRELQTLKVVRGRDNGGATVYTGIGLRSLQSDGD